MSKYGRMSNAKAAATLVVNSLTNIDFMSVVTFSTTAQSENSMLVRVSPFFCAWRLRPLLLALLLVRDAASRTVVGEARTRAARREDSEIESHMHTRRRRRLARAARPNNQVRAEANYRSRMITDIENIQKDAYTHYVRAVKKAFEITAKSDSYDYNSGCTRVCVRRASERAVSPVAPPSPRHPSVVPRPRRVVSATRGRRARGRRRAAVREPRAARGVGSLPGGREYIRCCHSPRR